MNTTRMSVLSCGCVCACAMHAAVAQDIPPSVDAADATDAAPEENAGRVALASLPNEAPIPAPTGLRVQFDSGTMENVHRIVGFWPSVHWLNSRNIDTSMGALGYSWRNLKLEGALFRVRESEQFRGNSELLRIDSAAKRLGYKLGPHWALQFSRGFISTPDQFRQDQRSKRRTASLTYRGGYSSNPWNTTLAVGYGKGPSGHSGNAYLLDSAMRLGEEHTVFGRFERGGHDELFRDEDGPRDRSHDVSKMSAGYLYEPKMPGTMKLSFGGVVSQRAVPNELLSYYGDKTTYMVFMRLQVKFGGN